MYTAKTGLRPQLYHLSQEKSFLVFLFSKPREWMGGHFYHIRLSYRLSVFTDRAWMGGYFYHIRLSYRCVFSQLGHGWVSASNIYGCRIGVFTAGHGWVDTIRLSYRYVFLQPGYGWVGTSIIYGCRIREWNVCVCGSVQAKYPTKFNQCGLGQIKFPWITKF